MLNARKAGVFLIALIAGTGCSLTSKFLLSVHGTTAAGDDEALASPLVQTAGMFLAMTLALPMHLLSTRYSQKMVGQGGYEQVAENLPDRPVDSWIYFVMAAPSVFDMLATALCMFGLVNVNVSLYQMLRGGSSIAFTSLMKHFFLPGDGLQLQNWVGVAFCLVSILLCGAVASGDSSAPPADPSASASSSSPPDAHSIKTSPLTGVCLILTGGVVQSLQYVFEERVMNEDVGLAPLLVVGLEGLWGFVFCAGLLLPIVYALPGNDHGHLEDPLNSLDMIARSGPIQLCFGTYLAFIFAYNSFSVMVTNELDSVWHSILDLWRPVTVWLLSLGIHYGAELGGVPGAKLFGEAWVFPGSGVQLVAMATLLYGTAVYNGSAPIPSSVQACLVACGVVEADALERARLTPTPALLTSPNLTRSPLLVRSIRQREEHLHPGSAPPPPQGAGGQAPAQGSRGAFELPPKAPLGTRRFSDV